MASGYYPATGRKVPRRDFIKLMAAVGTVMTFTPFVDWGKFLPNNRLNIAGKARVETDGKPANIGTFPVNHSEVVIYPKTDDATLNKEAFRTWLLIRLPAELGGKLMMCLLFGSTAGYASTSGASGNTNRRARSAPVPAMPALMILPQARLFGDLRRFRGRLVTCFLGLTWKRIQKETFGSCHLPGTCTRTE